MRDIQQVIQPIAPNLTAAMNSPIAGAATNFLAEHLNIETGSSKAELNTAILTKLSTTQGLEVTKQVDRDFADEMKKVDIDVFKLAEENKTELKPSSHQMPQVVLSVILISAYFIMLAAMFFVEVSDNLNMKQGENSLMGELKILLGVMTAGVGQVLAFWFGSTARE